MGLSLIINIFVFITALFLCRYNDKLERQNSRLRKEVLLLKIQCSCNDIKGIVQKFKVETEDCITDSK